MVVVEMEGVSLYPLKRIAVPKGDVLHALKSVDDGFAGFGEAYFTQIEPGKAKGWKRHNRMILNLVVVVGRVKFVIYDDRQGSKTQGEFVEVTLSPEDNYQRHTVDSGLWMAFYGADEQTSLLMDIIPEPHDDQEADKKDLSDIPYQWE